MPPTSTGRPTRNCSGLASPGLVTGDVDFAFACWVRVNATTAVTDVNRGEAQVAGKWGNMGEWLLALNSSSGTDQFRFLVASPSGAIVAGPATAFSGGLDLGRWFFVVLWHDAAANTLNLSVDGVLIGSTPHAAGVRANQNQPFHLGRGADASIGFPAISLARATFFRSPPGGIGSVIGELVTALYNGGAGLDPAEISTDQVEAWGLVACWPLDEPSGTRRAVFCARGPST